MRADNIKKEILRMVLATIGKSMPYKAGPLPAISNSKLFPLQFIYVLIAC